MKNKTDYSTGWRHYDVKKKGLDYKVGDLVYSTSGNNFGDQIIHYRRYEEFTDEQGRRVSGLRTYHTETNQEGSWIPEKFIKMTAKQLAKKSA